MSKEGGRARKRSGSKARALALTKSQRRDRAHVQASVGGDVLTVSHQVNPQLDHATPTIFTRWGSHTQSSSSPDGFTPGGTHAVSYPA